MSAQFSQNRVRLAVPHCPLFEFLPAELCDSPLRLELVNDPLVMENGKILRPEAPGLGVELNYDALEKFKYHG